jgi:hypothetical protein
MATIKKIKKAQGGTYIATNSGRVGRTNGMYGPYESMDTTGYSKGKKEFEVKTSYGPKGNSSKTIKREAVPAKIAELKKGATRQTKMKSGGSTPAWQRKAGKNPTGGLNAKGRASYNRANPGSNLKAPQPQGGARKRSFCARMSGVKGPAKKPNGEPTRKTLALRKWKC